MTENFGKFCAGILSTYKNKYSYANQWNLKKIEQDTIKLPILENGEIDYNNYLINFI